MVKSPAALARQVVRSARRVIYGVPAAPRWVQVEINNTCNLRCVMCPRDAMTRKAQYMTFDEFRRIADQCRALGT